MKPIFTILLIAFALCSSLAQTPCDSTVVVVISPIPPLCTNEVNISITATPSGGVFSGPFINSDGTIDLSLAFPGTYSATYTYTDPVDNCIATAAADFTIADPPDAFAFSSGLFDCSASGSSTVNLNAFYDGDGFYYWTGPNNFQSYDFNTTADYAGTYWFVAEDFITGCVTEIPVQVDQVNEAEVNIIDCTDCENVSSNVRLGVDINTTGSSVFWHSQNTGLTYGGPSCFPVQTNGIWTVEVVNWLNGCVSTDMISIPYYEDAVPSVNAGATTPIPCHGVTGTLLGAHNQTEFDFQIEWTTNDGNLVSGINTLTPYFNQPGTYFLTVTNPYNGCFDVDSVIVAEAPITTFVNDTICANSNFWAYTQTGTYIDTFPSFYGCDSIRILDLIVYDSIGLQASLVEDNGTANGSVFLNLTGDAPFSFNWSTGLLGTDPFLTGLSSGNYEVTVSSINGCTLAYDFEIGLDSLSGGNSSIVNGLTFFDANNNCIFDEGEQVLPNLHVVLANENTYAQNSNLNGAYTFPVSMGDYYLSANVPSPLWSPCFDSIALTIDNDFDTLTVNYPMQALVNSPILNVEIAATALRRCFENTYTIHYENNGTAMATDAYLELLFDDDLEVVSSSLEWSNVSGTLYTFDLGDIEVGESGSFSVVVIPDCASTSLGDILCLEAHIFPDTIPDFSPMTWNGALITVDGTCEEGELIFTIKNIGVGDMSETKSYIVIEDAVLNATDDFNLTSGSEEVVNIVGNGSTFWLRAEQEDGAPADPFPGYAIEGCEDGMATSSSTGFMNNFIFSDLGHFVDIDCRQVVGSFDPNQKVAFPDGFTAANFIEPGTPIEYMIEFQNTGTDTAFKVEIVDVLSKHLDLTTFETINSSHPYHYNILPNNQLTFTFDPIALPDSTTNEVQSHGFVKFRIHPKNDLVPGTIIENQAAIYFDFNEPIITNTTRHTIWEGTIFDIFTSNISVIQSDVQLTIFPNPFQQTARLLLEGEIKGPIQFQLFDVVGHLVYQKQENTAQFDIQVSDLSAGIYFFTVSDDRGVLKTGKVVLE